MSKPCPSPAFVRARLASLLAIVPLGVWTFVHVWDNLSALRGPKEWEASVTSYAHPVSQLAWVLLAIVPLGVHTVWGVGRLRTSRPNNDRYGYYANLKYLLQRISAVGVLLFLGAHLWLAWLRPRFVLGQPETFADLSHEMRHHLPTLVVYLLGTLGVAYHLGNGLHTALMGWGVTASREALRGAEWVGLGLFAILLAMSWTVVIALYLAG